MSKIINLRAIRTTFFQVGPVEFSQTKLLIFTPPLFDPLLLHNLSVKSHKSPFKTFGYFKMVMDIIQLQNWKLWCGVFSKTVSEIMDKNLKKF